ncbi:hypothetical protein Tco_1323381 [Tanacetum coccineum]
MSNQVTNWDKVNHENKIVNESLSAELERYKERVKMFEQRLNVDLNSREKFIDSKMDDMIRNKNALKQEIDSLKQTLSKQVKKNESLLQTFTVFKKESQEKENKYMDKEIDLENKIKELDNIVYKVGQSAQTPTLYDGVVISKKHDVISVVDEEEPLILEEESRSKMLTKQNDPISKEKKINISPNNYTELNKLAEDFGKRFVPKKELSAEQTFWLLISNPISEQLVVQTTSIRTEAPSELPKNELFLDNDRLLEYIICQDVMNIVMHADSIPVNVLHVNYKCLVNDNLESERLIQENDHVFELLLSQDIVHICVNSLATLTDYNKMEKDYIEEYKENLVLKAKLAKKDHMVENKFFNEVGLRCSRLINHSANLELKLQHQKETKLNIKDVSIANLRKHIKKIKGKNVDEKDVLSNNAKVIAPGMFKLDLEPLSPKVLKNIDAYIDFIKHTQDHADMLQELVEHARALRTWYNDLDFACKYSK